MPVNIQRQLRQDLDPDIIERPLATRGPHT